MTITSPDADSLISALEATSLAGHERNDGRRVVRRDVRQMPLNPDDVSVIFSRMRYRAMSAHDLHPSAGGYTIKARKQIKDTRSNMEDLKEAVKSHGNKVVSFRLSFLDLEADPEAFSGTFAVYLDRQ